MSQSRWQDIYLHLKNEGFSVYSPAQKTGECKAPYIVVKEANTSQYLNYSTTKTYYDLLCYIPKERYSEVSPYVDQVKKSMKDLFPMIQPTNSQTSPYFDEGVMAHMVSIQYFNYKRIIS